MFLRVLVLISLSFQLVGTFFLATRVIPRTWPERLTRNIRARHEKLLKTEIAWRRQLRILRDDVLMANSLVKVFTVLALIVAVGSEPGGLAEFLHMSKATYTKFKELELPAGMAGIMAFFRLATPAARLVERGILKVGNAGLLRVLDLLLFMLALTAIYMAYGLGRVSESTHKVTYFLIEGALRAVTRFRQKPGEEILSLLGICLLAAGFILQAIVNWTMLR